MMNCLSLFEFVVNLGGNMKVFDEFVLRLTFVDLKLSQNPFMPTTKNWPIFSSSSQES